MAVTMTTRWDNIGTVIPVGNAEYVVAEQPIAEYDNWFNHNIVADIQAVIDDVINKFNANTILKADTDNTPVALAIAEQTMVGRKTGGSVTALTATEVRTLLNVSSGTEPNLFEEVANVLREKSTGGYNNDFVIGSPQLDDDGNSAHDYRMWFDKGSGSFRAGSVTGTEWNSANVGTCSHAEGRNTTASGDQSHAEGYNTTANDSHAHAEGSGTLASNNQAHAEGLNTVASGFYSHAEGYATTASASASHADGKESSAYIAYQYSKSSGNFSIDGDAQYSNIVVSRETTDATQTELSLGGDVPSGSTRLVLPASRTWAFTINIAARQTAGIGTVGDSGIYKIEGGIKRDGSDNTAMVGVITKTVLAEDQSAWDVTAEANDGLGIYDSLVIKVIGEASKTIHWTAKVDLVEVG